MGYHPFCLIHLWFIIILLALFDLCFTLHPFKKRVGQYAFYLCGRCVLGSASLKACLKMEERVVKFHGNIV